MRKIDDDKLIEMAEAGIPQKEIAKQFGCSPSAVCQRLKVLEPPPESLQKLTAKQQRYALELAGGKTKTEAALASHDCSSRASAKALGIELYRNNDIQMAITDILREEGLSRRYRVQKLRQHVDSRDPNVSLKALDQGWKLSGSYQTKVDVSVGPRNHEEYLALVDEIEAIDEEIARLEGGGDVIDAEVVEDENANSHR